MILTPIGFAEWRSHVIEERMRNAGVSRKSHSAAASAGRVFVAAYVGCKAVKRGVLAARAGRLAK